EADDAEETLEEGLQGRSVGEERGVLLFLEESFNAQQNRPVRSKRIERLKHVVLASKEKPEIATASANAATLLNWVGAILTYQPWTGVQLPGADLSYCVLTGTELQGADLQNAYLVHSMLDEVNLEGADIQGAVLHDYSILKLKERVNHWTLHPHEPWAIGANENKLILYHRDTGEWMKESKPKEYDYISC